MVTWEFPLLREYEQEANPSNSDLFTARIGRYERPRMSARPIESVFGVPEPPSQAHSDAAISDIANHRNLRAPEGGQPDGAQPVTARHEQTTPSEPRAEWADDELQSIASTIQDLQSRLAVANERIANAAKVETTDVDIGRLFVEAQRFSEASMANLERQIHEILHEAEAKAGQILAEATHEAREIRSQAEEFAAASTKTARELSAAIAGFSSVNTELVKELSALNAVLLPAHEDHTPDNDRPDVDHFEGD
jgi:deoxyribodipyrimidine photolyase